MDLQELRFVVDTTQLEQASKKIGDLATAISSINKPMKDMGTAAQSAAKAVDSLDKAQQTSSETTRKSVSVLEKQQMVLEYMVQGYSRGQASMLATAKAAGALSDEIIALGANLKTQRTLMGTDPFDKSIGAMQALKNEYTVTKEVQRLFNAELGLTRTQMEDLAREKLRLIERYKIEGKTLKEIKQGMVELNTAYIQNAQVENGIVSSISKRQKATNDAAKANEYIAKELDRVNRLTQSNGNITSTTNNAIIRFEKALKQSGMTASQQVIELEKYKKSMAEIQKAGGNRQIDYLSRALGPQITDIFAGLATGQNPMTILIQQGGQLRDQFALAGVAGKDMGDMLKTAMSSMIISIKDVAVAIGGLVLGAITDVGKAVGTALVSPFTFAAETITKGWGNATFATKQLETALNTLGKVGLVALVATLATIAVETFKAARASDDLVKALYTQGAALGLTKDAALEMADSIANTYGKSVHGATAAITEFASKGVSANQEMVSAAMDYSKATGKALKDVVEEYKKLEDKSSEGLAEVAISTGFVDMETIKYIKTLEDQGRQVEASKLAQEELAKVHKLAASSIYKDLSPMGKLWADIKHMTELATGAVYEFANSSTVVNIFRTAWETVAVIVSEVWYTLKQTGNEIGGIAAQIAAVATGDFKRAADIGKMMKSDAAAAREAQDKLVASIMNRNKEEENSAAAIAKTRKANSDAAREYLATLDDQKKAKKDAEKEAKKVEDYYKRISERVSDLGVKVQGAANEQGKLTQAQKLWNDIVNDETYSKLTKSQQQDLKNRLEIISAQETLNEATKLHLELLKEIFKWEEERTKFSRENQASIDAENLLLTQRESLIGKTEEQARKLRIEYEAQAKIQKSAIKYDEMRLKASNEYFDILSKTNSREEAMKAEEEYQKWLTEINRLQGEELKTIHRGVAVSAAEDYRKEFEAIRDNIADILVEAMTNGGKAGAKKAADYLKAELKKQLTMNIKVQLDVILSGVSGKNGGQSQIASWLKTAGSMYSSYSSGDLYGSISEGVAKSYTFLADKGFDTAAGFLADFSDTLVAADKSLANFFGTEGVSTGLNSAFGYLNAINAAFEGKAGTAIGTAIGTYIMPGIGSTIGSMIGSLADEWFAGGAGTMHQGGAYIANTNGVTTRATNANLSGFGLGWGAYNSDRSAAFDSATKAYSTQVATALGAMSTALGGGTDNLLNVGTRFTSDWNDWSEGAVRVFDESGKTLFEYSKRYSSDAAAASKEFTADLSRAVLGTLRQLDLNDAIDALFDSVDPLKASLEEIDAVLQRAQQWITFSNAIKTSLNTLGHSIGTLLDTVSTTENFIASFGSLENYISTSSNYYKEFYSEAERNADVVESLTKAFSSLGLQLPASRDGFRALVDAQDLSTTSGQQTYAALLQLSGAFATVVSSVEDAKSTLESFTASITDVFANLRSKFDSLTSNLQESVKTIVGKTIKTPAQIASEIDSVIVNRPSTSGISSANSVVASATNLVNSRQSSLSQAITSQSTAQSGYNSVLDQYNQYEQLISDTQSQLQSVASARYKSRASKNKQQSDIANLQSQIASYQSTLSDLGNLLAQSRYNLDQQNATLATANTLYQAAIAAQSQAQRDQLQAMVDYATSTKEFIKDAATATDTLDGLRQDVMDYYQQQTELVNTMLASAGNLRKAIEGVYTAGLTASGLSSKLQQDFDRTYTMALSTSGATQAGYADQLASLLPSAVDAIKAVSSTRLEYQLGAAKLMGQSTEIANLLEQNAPVDYQAEALGLLSQIDDALARIVVNTDAAENVIANAIYETGSSNINGLRAIVAALKGESVPAFATGGYHSGGLRIVGENGPELEATGPSRIFNANQTASMLNSGGNNEALIEELRAVKEELVMLRVEVRADVSHNAKTAKLLDRVIPDGQSIQTTVVA